jgi:hypothetical protein
VITRGREEAMDSWSACLHGLSAKDGRRPPRQKARRPGGQGPEAAASCRGPARRPKAGGPRAHGASAVRSEAREPGKLRECFICFSGDVFCVSIDMYFYITTEIFVFFWASRVRDGGRFEERSDGTPFFRATRLQDASWGRAHLSLGPKVCPIMGPRRPWQQADGVLLPAACCC